MVFLLVSAAQEQVGVSGAPRSALAGFGASCYVLIYLVSEVSSEAPGNKRVFCEV